MIQITETLYLGNSDDAKNLKEGSLLNVAADLDIVVPKGILYAKCGLVDGPGNIDSIYIAATLILASLARGPKTLVVDHDCAGLCTTIAIMYLHASQRMGWDHWLKQIREKRDISPHQAHRSAFFRMNWRLLGVL